MLDIPGFACASGFYCRYDNFCRSPNSPLKNVAWTPSSERFLVKNGRTRASILRFFNRLLTVKRPHAGDHDSSTIAAFRMRLATSSVTHAQALPPNVGSECSGLRIAPSSSTVAVVVGGICPKREAVLAMPPRLDCGTNRRSSRLRCCCDGSTLMLLQIVAERNDLGMARDSKCRCVQ